MKILLTGFEPFGGESINPAQEAVQLVKDEIKGAQIVKCYVPVVFGKAIDTVHEALKKENPDAVLLIGQAGGRYEITPERIAINCDDGRIPDNEGNQPVDQPVRADGPAAYFSTLPIKKMVQYIKAANVPAAVSNTAGTYVCNHLMYGVLYYLDKEFPNTIGGFMHVPYLHEQVMNKKETASLSKDDVVKGIEAALEAIVDHLA
ncbi:MAG: pyroglutamyl-peptidase I [Erysipelotrichaceae bacterium]|jgi:pyroglutamyl-peptidase|nr:pyroglutamyl-peptidase I [Erysipelotrichaceae bacterium]MBQ1757407.1 pyroglutamyl-peptidase I [Erysipelotrichaceae bacterium]MBQ2214542.1 pyroglutamyl-peptidase I [Erysipelotrichaceae bacterium]MBQ3383757.1 pyroglutamyl-peptidase I [Erysipelotrichaceae bacterium]MBR2599517.1 pyroglutamyl-peptidase I [Erysipelotrichaceae bacterium]